MTAWRRPPGRRGPQPLLTMERHQRIVELLRSGAYENIAAQAAGVGLRTFYRWVSRGEADPDDPLYGPFAADVAQARAEARSVAEVRVHQERPEVWLTKGPGRSRQGRPGWTDVKVEVEVTLAERQAELLARVMAGVLTDPKVGLTRAQLEAARMSLKSHIATAQGQPEEEIPERQPWPEC
jgi:hypothetical protein